MVRGVIGRLIKMELSGDKEQRKLDLREEDYNSADRMLAWLLVSDTIQLSSSTDLSGLSPFVWEGQLYTRGRIGTRLNYYYVAANYFFYFLVLFYYLFCYL